LTRVALLVVGIVVVAGVGFFVLHKSPKAMSPTAGQVLSLRRHAVTVPDVRGQSLVLAKGELEQDGFAWGIKGPVKGFHENVVVSQSPAQGTRLLDTGTPLVTLRLKQSGAQTGAPQQHSAAPGTPVTLYHSPVSGVAAAATATTAPVTHAATTTAKPPATTTHPATTTPPVTTTAHTTTTPHATTAKQPPPKTTPAPKPTTVAAAPKGQKPYSDRPPAFLLPGNAHRERQGEMPLPTRAALLLQYVRNHPKPTNAAVKHWLVQQDWIVDGARFGWWHGAQALEKLLAVDHAVEGTWGIGYRSEAQARAALAYVHAHEVKR
jgi:hypothetical protein